MEDERVISLTTRISKSTIEFLLKTLWYGSLKAYEVQKDFRQERRIFQGEIEWNKFMQSLEPVTVHDIKNNQANLGKFKKELEKYGIGFSFYKHPDGENVSIAFLVKHKEIVEKALNKTIEKMVKKENFVDNVKKKPEEKSIKEKLNYYSEKKKQTEKTIKESVKEKAEIKQPTKGEKSL